MELFTCKGSSMTGSPLLLSESHLVVHYNTKVTKVKVKKVVVFLIDPNYP